jgi:hypothetical protein
MKMTINEDNHNHAGGRDRGKDQVRNNAKPEIMNKSISMYKLMLKPAIMNIKNRLVAIAAILIISLPAMAQDYNWQEITEEYDLPEGIKAFRETTLNAWYLEVDLNVQEIIVHPYIGPSQNLLPFAQSVGAIASINGGFFSGSTSLSTVIYPEEVKARNVQTLSRPSGTYYVTRGFFGLREDRSPMVEWVYHFSNLLEDFYRFDRPIPNTQTTPAPPPVKTDGEVIGDVIVGIGGAPVLVKNGQIDITYDEEVIWGGIGGFAETRARTAVGYTEDNRVILFVNNESPGLGFQKLAEIMLDLGSFEALNLDGGGSTHMTIGNQLVNKTGHTREVPTILAIVPADSLKLPVKQSEIILDTEFDNVVLTGSGWFETANAGFYGDSRSMLAPIGDGGMYATYSPDLAGNEEYEVYAWWVASFNRATDTPVVVRHRDGIDTLRVNQAGNGSMWNLIGTYTFAGTSDDQVIISNAATTGQYVVADGVRFVGPEKTGTSVIREGMEIPSSVVLQQNYPNPFNPVTNIRFQLPESRNIRLEVFDALGRSVQILAEGNAAAGSHTYKFDASALSSGLYIYTLTAGSNRTSRTMMLVK